MNFNPFYPIALPKRLLKVNISLHELSAVKVEKIRFMKVLINLNKEKVRLMNRSKIAIYNAKIRVKDSNKIKRSGRKKILTARDNQRIFQLTPKIC